jgi:hypothetical protein
MNLNKSTECILLNVSALGEKNAFQELKEKKTDQLNNNSKGTCSISKVNIGSLLHSNCTRGKLDNGSH